MLSVLVCPLPSKANQKYSNPKDLPTPMLLDHSKELLVLETFGHVRYPRAALIEPCHDLVIIVLLLASFKCLCRFKHGTVMVVLAFHRNRVARLAFPHFGNPTWATWALKLAVLTLASTQYGYQIPRSDISKFQIPSVRHGKESILLSRCASLSWIHGST